ATVRRAYCRLLSAVAMGNRLDGANAPRSLLLSDDTGLFRPGVCARRLVRLPSRPMYALAAVAATDLDREFCPGHGGAALRATGQQSHPTSRRDIRSRIGHGENDREDATGAGVVAAFRRNRLAGGAGLYDRFGCRSRDPALHFYLGFDLLPLRRRAMRIASSFTLYLLRSSGSAVACATPHDQL